MKIYVKNHFPKYLKALYFQVIYIRLLNLTCANYINKHFKENINIFQAKYFGRINNTIAANSHFHIVI